MAKKSTSKASSWAQEEQARQTAELDAAIVANDAEELLSTLYGLWPWDEAPNRAAELEPQKSAIIKELLTELKLMDSSDSYMSLASELDMLVALGVSWPELNLIRNGMDEEDRRRSAQGMWESNAAHQISQGDIEKVIAVLDHNGYKYGSDPDTDALFDDKINVIQKWMQRMLDISIADGIYAWRMIHDMDLPWDSVDSWWTDHKADILRSLLEMMKDGAYGRVYDIIDEDLRALNLRWPELTVISRSAELEMERQAAQDALDEAADDDEEEDEGPIWRRITPEEAELDTMYRNMRDGRWQAIKNGIAALEDRDLDDGDIEALLNPQQDSIVRWLDSKLRQRTHDQLILGQMWQLLEIGARWPDLRKFVEAHKDQLVRNMLEDLKNFNDAWVLENMEGHVRQLRELGVAWPELAVISRSVEAELDRQAEISESGDMLGYRISKGDIIDGMRDSLRAGHNGAWGNNYALMRPFWKPDFTVRKLAGIKPDIVAWVNKYLSNDNSAHWRYGKRAVVDLDDLGVDWPELWRIVDSNKRAWLHPWLAQLKELIGEFHYDDIEDLESNIRLWRDHLAKHGINWPEIETILSSIRAATNAKGHLGEAQLGDMQGMLRRRHANAVDYMKNLKLKSGQTLLQRITPIKADIVDWVDHQLAQDFRSQQKAKRTVTTLSNMGADWPELWTVVNRHRSAWIKFWLEMIKEAEDDDWESYGMVEDEINNCKFMLAKHGIKWPEIAIIEKHLQLIADRQRGAAQDQLDESKPTKGVDLRKYVSTDGRGTLFLNIPVDQIWHTSGKGYWSDMGAKPVKVISIKQDMETGDADGWISDLGVEFDTSTWNVKSDGLIYTDPQFLAQLHKFLMGLGVPRDIVSQISYSEQGMQEDTYVSFDANAFGDYVADQFVIGDAKTMDDRKTEIIRAMLVNIRDGNQNRAAGIFNQLRQLGAKWPELDAIEKSLRAGKNLTESALAREALTNAKRSLWSELPGGNWWTVGRVIDRMIYATVTKDDIRTVLEGFKRDILTQQNQLTQGQGAEVLAGLTNLRRLSMAGVNWPEIGQMLTRNKRHIMRAALQEIKHFGSEDLSDDELPSIYKHLKQLNVAWPEMAVIADGIDTIRQLGEAAGPKMIATGAGKIKNPAHSDDVKYEGSPDAYDFGPQKANYDALKALLARNGKRLTYLAVERSTEGPDTLVATGPGVVWFKKTQWGGGGNWVWINGVKSNLSTVLKLSPAAQDALFTAPQSQAIKATKGKPLAYVKALVADGVTGRQLRSEVDSVADQIVGDLAKTLSYNADKLSVYRRFISRLEHDSGTKLSSLDPQLVIDKAMPMLMQHLIGNLRWDSNRFENLLKSYKDNGIKIWPNDIKAEILKQWSEIQQQLHDVDNIMDGRSMTIGRRLRGFGIDSPEIEEKNLQQQLQDNKAKIIKNLLSRLRDGHISLVKPKIDRLKQFGVTWPELDVMLKSINSQLSEDWHDVDTDDYDEVYGRVGSALQDIENGLRTHMEEWHAEMVVNGLADLASLLDDTDWLDAPTPSEYSLDLAKQKPLFVKALLFGMKHSDHDNVQDAIRMLEDYWHVRWPELDTINKSMRAGKLKESAPSHDEEAYRYAEEMAANLPEVAADPVDAMHVFLHAADHPQVIGPWAAEYFAPHKDLWIRWLLAQMKGDEYATDEIYEAVSMLKRMRLPWPELDVIVRSMGADFRG